MRKNGKIKLMQIVSFLLSIVAAWVNSERLGSSEFSGGQLTGHLLALHNCGLYLLALALLFTFVFPRVAAGIAMLASLLSIPTYLYLVAPGLFHGLFGGEYSIPLHGAVTWSSWTTSGVLTLVLVVFVCLRSFMSLYGGGVKTGAEPGFEPAENICR